VLAVGNCCYVAVCSAAQGASAPTGEERGGAYHGGRPPTAYSNYAVDVPFSVLFWLPHRPYTVGFTATVRCVLAPINAVTVG